MPENSQLAFLWKQISERLQNSISPLSYSNFFKDMEPIDVVGRKIILKAPTDNNAQAIMTHKFGEKLRDAIVKCDIGLSDFRLVVDGSDIFTMQAEEDATQVFRVSPIKKEFTFDSFVAGAGSKFVYAAAKAVAENPGESFNPLFIYGESGLGKTHLMHAIANYLAVHAPEKKVLQIVINDDRKGIRQGYMPMIKFPHLKRKFWRI